MVGKVTVLLGYFTVSGWLWLIWYVLVMLMLINEWFFWLHILRYAARINVDSCKHIYKISPPRSAFWPILSFLEVWDNQFTSLMWVLQVPLIVHDTWCTNVQCYQLIKCHQALVLIGLVCVKTLITFFDNDISPSCLLHDCFWVHWRFPTDGIIVFVSDGAMTDIYIIFKMPCGWWTPGH